MHGAEHIFLAANKPDIERIPGNTAARPYHHRQRCQAGFMLVMSPQGGKHKVSQREIDDCRGHENEEPSSSDWERFHHLALTGV